MAKPNQKLTNFIRTMCSMFVLLPALRGMCMQNLINNDKNDKRIKIICRLSEDEFNLHKALVNECGMTSQQFLYINLIGYKPNDDPRLSYVIQLDDIMKKVNETSWKLKNFLEGMAQQDPAKKHVDIRFWSANTAVKFLERLHSQLCDISNKLKLIYQVPQQHKKLINEESKNSNKKLTKYLFVRISTKDKNYLTNCSKQCLLSLSSYMRLIATGKQPKSRDTLLATEAMFKIIADLGRIKGVMNYWLSKSQISHFRAMPRRGQLIISINSQYALKLQQLARAVMQKLFDEVN